MASRRVLGTRSSSARPKKAAGDTFHAMERLRERGDDLLVLVGDLAGLLLDGRLPGGVPLRRRGLKRVHALGPQRLLGQVLDVAAERRADRAHRRRAGADTRPLSQQGLRIEVRLQNQHRGGLIDHLLAAGALLLGSLATLFLTT